MPGTLASLPTARQHENYTTDASGFKGWAETVFIPPDEAGVVAILQQATQRGVPVTVVGAGSGLTGGRVADGGWVISLEKFNGVEIAQRSARAGAAVTLLQLRQEASRTRQFYAPDPTEIMASMGGTVATNASGSRSFLYGSTRRHLLGLRVAWMDGRVVEYRRGDKIDFAVPAIPLPGTTKSTAGYPLHPGMDWIDLICGSEGTLGVVLEAEVALLPVPAELFSAVVFFSSDDAAVDAVDDWRPVAGLRMLEYADRNSLDLLRRRYPEIPDAAAAALLIESEGIIYIEEWDSRLKAAHALSDDSWFAVTTADRERFRKFRHALPELVNATVIQGGFQKAGTDYAVPVHRNREMLTYYRRRLQTAMPGQYLIFGHIGDAHVHVNMLPATKQQEEATSMLFEEFARHAVNLGGTVSAEHGLGKRKAHLLRLQYAPEHIDAMMAVKSRLDPHWLLGRGTLFPVPARFTGRHA